MNYNDFLDIFKNCQLINDKIMLKSDLYQALEYVKNNYNFNILKEIIALDNSDGTFELIYNLYSTKNNKKLLLSIIITDNKADSISALYDSATMDEKEIYDLFGITFIGNNELKRLYLPEAWQGHPMKKNYVSNDMRLNWND